jgi:hypothetical protein
MYNVNRKSGKIGRNDIRVISAYNGWHDALNNRPLNPEFSDHSEIAIAATYINWRLRACEVQRVMGKVPVWRTTRQVPHQVFEAFRSACLIEIERGNLRAMPINRMPDDPNLKFL